MIYKAILPFLRISTSSIAIKDSNDVPVGMMERYYSNNVQRLLNYLLDNIVNNVRAYDQNGDLQIDIKEINTVKTLFVEKWHVELKKENFICEKKTRIKTNPEFYYEKSSTKVWIKKDFADKITRFIVDQHVAAEVHPEGMLPPKSNHITFKIFDERVSIYEIAALYYVFILKN
ncbi:tubby C-terminal domain-like protein [Paenibacillus planticolens]|uniref:Tubby C-terminal domain-containing protein n=1 Tax=Paenibacillus planticolens TaxID=2654976 RepID=A0ABX1ZWS3_9BACL|nr:hypothetical protein [Paenibacillus planticolens]NOV04497.1 hypothetical protein [Paenibacillus planticolens]